MAGVGTKARNLLIVWCLITPITGAVPSVPSSLIEDLSRQLEDVASPYGLDRLPHLPTLLDALGMVPDPRSARGRRHALSFRLAVAVLAVLSGADRPARRGARSAARSRHWPAIC